MTIAAAMVYDNGILLCADTQQEAGAMKIHGSKLGEFSCPGGRIGYVIAGNSRFALSAIQKAAKSIRNANVDETMQTPVDSSMIWRASWLGSRGRFFERSGMSQVRQRNAPNQTDPNFKLTHYRGDHADSHSDRAQARLSLLSKCVQDRLPRWLR